MHNPSKTNDITFPFYRGFLSKYLDHKFSLDVCKKFAGVSDAFSKVSPKVQPCHLCFTLAIHYQIQCLW